MPTRTKTRKQIRKHKKRQTGGELQNYQVIEVGETPILIRSSCSKNSGMIPANAPTAMNIPTIINAPANANAPVIMNVPANTNVPVILNMPANTPVMISEVKAPVSMFSPLKNLSGDVSANLLQTRANIDSMLSALQRKSIQLQRRQNSAARTMKNAIRKNIGNLQTLKGYNSIKRREGLQRIRAHYN